MMNYCCYIFCAEQTLYKNEFILKRRLQKTRFNQDGLAFRPNSNFTEDNEDSYLAILSSLVY